MSPVLSILGLIGGLVGACAAAYIAVRKAPSEVHLTEAQERKIAAETELLVTQTIKELREELAEAYAKLQEAYKALETARLSEAEAHKETADLRARVAELEKRLIELNHELESVQRVQGMKRTRHTDEEDADGVQRE